MFLRKTSQQQMICNAIKKSMKTFKKEKGASIERNAAAIDKEMTEALKDLKRAAKSWCYSQDVKEQLAKVLSEEEVDESNACTLRNYVLNHLVIKSGGNRQDVLKKYELMSKV